MSVVSEFFIMQTMLVIVMLGLNTYMGIHIIRRGIIFCDLVLNQLAAFGVIIGLGLGICYGTPLSYAIPVAAVLAGCAILAVTRPKDKRVSEEAVIGILYGIALTASLLLADKLPGGGTYLGKTLTGSMLWVSWPLVLTTVVVYAALGFFHYIFRGRFLKLTENPELLRHRGFWDFLFFATLGVITILIVPVAGVLLAYGFMMIPASIAVLFGRGWKAGLIFGWTTGTIASLLGVLMSYRFDLPYGPTILLVMAAFFIGALVTKGIMTQLKTMTKGSAS